MTPEIEELYQKIADEIVDFMPEEDWNTIWIPVEMEDDHGSTGCYYITDKSREPISIEASDGIFDIFYDMRELYKKHGKEPWSSATFILESDGKFSIDFGYGELLPDDPYERRLEWKKQYLK